MNSPVLNRPPLVRFRLAWLPVPLLLAVMVALWIANPRTPHESRTLLVLTNLVFSGLVSLCIGYLAGRSFLVSGQPGLVMLGCGALLWGMATVVAGALVNLGGNLTITIHNLGVLGAGFCHLIGLVWRGRLHRPGRWLAAGYAGVLAVVALLIWATMAGWTPVFFVQGQGGTWVRQVVLGSAIALFASAAGLMLTIHHRQSSALLYWYGLGLALLAVGLAGVWMQSVHGSVLGWTGRITQCLGGAYLFISALAAARETGTWQISLGAVEEAWRKGELLAGVGHRPPLGWALRYSLAGGAAAAGWGLRLALEAWSGHGLPPFITFFPAIMVAALLAGFGPGLLATALTGWVAAYWIMPPAGQHFIASPVDRLALALFGSLGLFMSVVAEFYRRYRRKAAAYDQEEALRETRREKEFLANLLEHASQPFAVGYPDGRLGRLNHAYAKLTGYTAAELRGLDWSATLTPPEWRELESRKIEELHRTGEPVRYEKEYVRKDGSRVPIELLVHLARDAAGNPEYYYTFLADITERRRAEEAARESAERLGQLNAELQAANTSLIESRAAAINLMEDALAARQQAEQAGAALQASEQRMQQALRVSRSFTFEWRPATDRVLRSASCAPILKLAGDEVHEDTGQHFFQCVHPDDRARFVQMLDALTPAADTYTSEYRVVRGDGSVVVLEEMGQAAFDAAGKLERLVGVTTDITARRQAEETVQRSEAMLNEAERIAHIGSWDWDVRTGEVSWSDEMFRLFGEDRGSFVPSYEGFLARIHPDDRQHTDGVVRNSLAQGGGYAVEYRVLTHQGETRVVLAQAEVILNPDGRPRRMVGTALDITERKRAEHELFALNERLKALMEAVPVGISFSEDSTCQHISGNPAVLAQFEVSPEDNLSASASDATAPGRQARFFRAGRPIADAELPLQRAVAENQVIPPMELEVVMPSGRRWFADASGAPVRNAQGQVTGGIAVTIDITARKQAQEALQRSRDRQVLLSRTVGALLVAPDPQAIVERLCNDVRTFLNCDVFFNFLLDPGASRLRLNACGGVAPKLARKVEGLELGESVCGCVARDACRIVAEQISITSDPRTALVKALGVRAYAAHPLLGPHQEVLGTLSFGTCTRDTFAEEDLGLMKEVADHVAIAMSRKQAEEALKGTLKEKEVLLREIHHRVKNNLQVISSLLGLQADSLADPGARALFDDARDRVRSMALVHEQLYQSESLARVDFADYARRVLDYLWRAQGATAATVRLKLSLEPLLLSIETAVPCGLVLNELASNALKHAFRGRSDGELAVSLHRDGKGRMTLGVRDNGVGLPAGLDWRHSPSLGLRLVQMLAGQMRGTVETGSGPGTEFRLTFPVKEQDVKP